MSKHIGRSSWGQPPNTFSTRWHEYKQSSTIEISRTFRFGIHGNQHVGSAWKPTILFFELGWADRPPDIFTLLMACDPWLQPCMPAALKMTWCLAVYRPSQPHHRDMFSQRCDLFISRYLKWYVMHNPPFGENLDGNMRGAFYTLKQMKYLHVKYFWKENLYCWCAIQQVLRLNAQVASTVKHSELQSPLVQAAPLMCSPRWIVGQGCLLTLGRKRSLIQSKHQNVCILGNLLLLEMLLPKGIPYLLSTNWHLASILGRSYFHYDISDAFNFFGAFDPSTGLSASFFQRRFHCHQKSFQIHPVAHSPGRAPRPRPGPTPFGAPKSGNLESKKKTKKHHNSQNQNPFCPKCRQGPD